MGKAADTRLNILQKAFGHIYRNGFQATSIDDILAKTQLTKGAFFYHFKNKEEMGLAMIREVMQPGMEAAMIGPLRNSENATGAIYAMMEGLLISPLFFTQYGCPAVNLIEEMSPLNAGFREALTELSDNWRKAITDVLKQGKIRGEIGSQTDPEAAALFIIAGYNGVRNLGKIWGTVAYTSFLKSLKIYLQTLVS
ncbi:MAG: TetR/AcrR family transcriptional regulator [Mucilaginibacter polytrichastri]|nr:TetR/AcrR family transcriptional regulator [Mucilaginibacter polytrichastri]